MILGEGPIPCRTVLIGEMPGVEEVRAGRPFVGRAGKELNRFLNGYTCPHRHELYLTNLKKRPREGKEYVVDPDEFIMLADELSMLRPDTVVTLGHHVTQFFLGPDATLEATHGIPHRDLHDRYSIFPTYNPAAILYSPSQQSVFAYDMKRLGLYLKGTLAPPPTDERPGVYTDESEDETLYTSFVGLDVAMDTEGWLARPWCASYAYTKYKAGVVLADTPGWRALCRQILADGPIITLHNALHDLAVLRAMGLDLDESGLQFDDTMIMAYLLGLEPQGLKPLGYRHAGARHDDYSDIVAGPNAEYALQWLVQLLARLGPETDADLAHSRKLLETMLGKPEWQTLRKRWGECRAREILVDETAYLVDGHTDPPEATLDDVPREIAVNYAGRDADLTGRVKRALRPQITALALDDVYQTDLAVVPMIDRMQSIGLETDVEHFRQLSVALHNEYAYVLEEIEKMVGRPVNPNSPKQIEQLLYGDLRLHERVENVRIKKTKGGALTTDDKVLEALSLTHPIVPLIQEGREIRKLKGTYSDVIPTLVSADGRLHPRYRLTRAETGRLTAADPNVLAFPKWSRRGKLVRMGFRAGPGHVLGEWDLSQIEMRVMAHDSGDENMIAQFWSGYDFHTSGAADKLKKALALVTELERFMQKAVNFGVLMGLTEYGLLAQMHKAKLLHMTLDECVEYLHGWFRQYPGVKTYQLDKHAEARKHGFVRDMFGRLRWLEGIHSTDKYIASEAERQAQATPIQSGAQGIIKRGMVLLWPVLKALRAAGVWVEVLLQIHDSLLVEYDPAYEDVVDNAVMTAITGAVQLRVPVTAKAHKGVQRWGEL